LHYKMLHFKRGEDETWHHLPLPNQLEYVIVV